MYVLYLDESGDPRNPNEENFVLAGISIFERQTYWVSQQLDSLEVELFGKPPSPGEVTPFARPVEFHAATIHSRSKPPWDSIATHQADQVLSRLAQVISECHESCALFGVVVHKPSFPSEDPVIAAFNELTHRFDLLLTRLHNQGDTQRGLMVLDESRHEQRLQTLLRTYALDGGPFGRLRNFTDVPLFADSRASRLLQLADFVAWSIFRRYERSLAHGFDKIVSRFDREGDRIHGLFHRTGNRRDCLRPACLSRRIG